MKKVLVIILTIVTIVGISLSYGEDLLSVKVPELLPSINEQEADENLPSYPRLREFYVNLAYRDINDSPFKEHIYRMGTEGIIKKFGSVNYNPDEYLTKQQAIEYMVRMIGLEDAVQTNVLQQSQGISNDVFLILLREEYVDQAIANGILLPEEEMNLTEPLTKEELAVYLSRTAGLAPVYGEQTTVMALEDWQLMAPFYRPFIEPLLAEGIMEPDLNGYFKPGDFIRRGEAARILEKLSDYTLEDRGMEKRYGLVTSKLAWTDQQPDGNIDHLDFSLRGIDGTTTNIVTTHNRRTNAQSGFILIKDGMPYFMHVLEIGDEIEYILQDGEVIYARVLDNGDIRELIKEEQSGGDVASEVRFAYVTSRSAENKWKDEEYVREERIRFRDIRGNQYELVVDSNLRTGFKNDITVYKDDLIGDSSLLQVDDLVQLLVQEGTYVVYAQVGDFEDQTVFGTIRNIDLETGVVTVLTYDNTFGTFELLENTAITINEEYAEQDNLKLGMDVELFVRNGYIINLKGETFVSEPGYIPAFSKMRIGTVIQTGPTSMKVRLLDQSVETYSLLGIGEVIRGGVVIEANGIREGDKVKLYFETISASDPGKVEVEGSEQLIERVYKGKLYSANGKIVITDPYYLSPAYWVKMDDYKLEFTLDRSVKIYDGEKELSVSELQTYYDRNDTIYLVAKSVYGNKTAVKVNIKQGGERKYYDDVFDLDRTRGEFELDGRQNFTYSEGTIFVKNGRLVEELSLNRNDSVYVISDYYDGRQRANVVRILDNSESIFENIVVGTIESVAQYGFTLANYAELDGNEWNETSPYRSRTYSYDEDTVFVEEGGLISAEDFFHGSYGRFENLSTDGRGAEYEHYYTFMVTDANGDVIGAKLRFNGLVPNQNIDDNYSMAGIPRAIDETIEDFVLSRGYVSSLDDFWKRITLTDANDWVSSLGQWNQIQANMSVEYDDVMVIKDQVVIEVEDIVPGDYIYIVRDEENALVIFVE